MRKKGQTFQLGRAHMVVAVHEQDVINILKAYVVFKRFVSHVKVYINLAHRSHVLSKVKRTKK